ncbi:MAG: hypothetical protein E7B59_20405 [Enterobacteriaceae bacterium]|nr:hypothetical protein [Enterobacteriaceae bacterium]
MELSKENLIAKLEHRISVAAKYPDLEEAQLDAEIFNIALAALKIETQQLVQVPTFEEWCESTNQKPIGWVRDAMMEAYEGCRAAMLTNEPVSQSYKLVGEVVAWNSPQRQGVYRSVDFCWLDLNVPPGTRVYARHADFVSEVDQDLPAK